MTDTAIEMRRESIPVKAEDLRKFILIGKQVVEAHKAKLRAIQQTEEAAAAHQAALEDGQTIAEIVLDAEAKLGEMLAGLPKPKFDKTINGSKRGTTETLPIGIDKKMSHEDQQIHKYPETVEQCKRKAREKGELVTSKCVLRQVHADSRNEVLPTRRKPGRPPRGYYLTEPRLSFLREKIERVLELLDVPARSVCPVTLIVAELHIVQEELVKLQPQQQRKKSKGAQNVV